MAIHSSRGQIDNIVGGSPGRSKVAPIGWVEAKLSKMVVVSTLQRKAHHIRSILFIDQARTEFIVPMIPTPRSLYLIVPILEALLGICRNCGARDR